MRLLEYKQFPTKTSLELKIRSHCNTYKLDGYKIFADDVAVPPGLNEVETYLKNIVADHPAEGQHAYHNPVRVVRDATSVYIEVIGVQTDVRRKLCSFELITKNPKISSMLQEIYLDRIEEIKNYRDVEPPSEKDPDMAELCASIKEEGVLQPILVRPHPVKSEMFQLVFGHRRRMAAKMAGLQTIPATIKDIADGDVLEIQITENLQRKDVHPLDEAQAYQTYKAMKKVEIPELAAKFGKTAAYIAQRLSFNALIPELRKDFHAGILMIGHAILLSRLQPADQKALIPTCKNHPHKGEPFYDSVEDMKETIEDQIMKELTHAGFDKKDAKLIPKAGACIACQKRSGAGLLFQDVKEKDRCFDAICFKAKSKAHLLQQIDKLVVSANPMPVVVGYSNRIDDAEVKKRLSDNKVKLLVEGQDYTETTKKATNATHALKITGSDAGKIIGITLKATPKAQAAKAAAPGATDEETVTSIDTQIAGIQERGKRSDALDAERVHASIITQLVGLKPFQEVDCQPSMIRASEHAAMLYILFQMMDDGDVQKVCAAMKVKGDKRYGRFFVADWHAIAKGLPNATPEIYAFITRSAIKSKLMGNKMPPSPEAYLVRQIAETYEGVPIATYEAEQKTIADKRKENARKRIADLENKKKALTPKKPKPKAADKKSISQVSSDLTDQRIKSDPPKPVGRKVRSPKKGQSGLSSGISKLLQTDQDEDPGDDE